MKFLLYFSDFIVPFTMFYIVVYGFFNRNDVYESFLKGVKEGFQIVIEIAPTMIALLVSIGIFRASGALDSFSELLAPAGKFLHIPVEVIPVFIVRIFSSSAAVSFVLDIFKDTTGIRDLEQAAEHLAAHALYMIEAEHQTQVVYNAEMVQELFH